MKIQNQRNRKEKKNFEKEQNGKKCKQKHSSKIQISTSNMPSMLTARIESRTMSDSV